MRKGSGKATVRDTTASAAEIKRKALESNGVDTSRMSDADVDEAVQEQAAQETWTAHTGTPPPRDWSAGDITRRLWDDMSFSDPDGTERAAAEEAMGLPAGSFGKVGRGDIEKIVDRNPDLMSRFVGEQAGVVPGEEGHPDLPPSHPPLIPPEVARRHPILLGDGKGVVDGPAQDPDGKMNPDGSGDPTPPAGDGPGSAGDGPDDSNPDPTPTGGDGFGGGAVGNGTPPGAPTDGTDGSTDGGSTDSSSTDSSSTDDGAADGTEFGFKDDPDYGTQMFTRENGQWVDADGNPVDADTQADLDRRYQEHQEAVERAQANSDDTDDDTDTDDVGYTPVDGDTGGHGSPTHDWLQQWTEQYRQWKAGVDAGANVDPSEHEDNADLDGDVSWDHDTPSDPPDDATPPPEDLELGDMVPSDPGATDPLPEDDVNPQGDGPVLDPFAGQQPNLEGYFGNGDGDGESEGIDPSLFTAHQPVVPTGHFEDLHSHEQFLATDHYALSPSTVAQYSVAGGGEPGADEPAADGDASAFGEHLDPAVTAKGAMHVDADDLLLWEGLD